MLKSIPCYDQLLDEPLINIVPNVFYFHDSDQGLLISWLSVNNSFCILVTFKCQIGVNLNYTGINYNATCNEENEYLNLRDILCFVFKTTSSEIS